MEGKKLKIFNTYRKDRLLESQNNVRKRKEGNFRVLECFGSEKLEKIEVWAKGGLEKTMNNVFIQTLVLTRQTMSLV